MPQTKINMIILHVIDLDT